MKNLSTINLNDVHPNYNVFRYEKYLQDVPRLKINKICMTEIVNADMMIATFGAKAYADACKEVLTLGKLGIKNLGLSNVIRYYTYNYKNFIVAGTDAISDEHFRQIIEGIYNQYMISSSSSSGLSGISRFVLAMGNDDLVDKALSAFYLHRNSQNNFIVATNEKEVLNAANNQDVDIFNLLNYAITHNKVIPFYQGINNNATNKIDKYEALMRISDETGMLYYPNNFLQTAKKYKLYNTLSKVMIDNVLNNFENIPYEVSINISMLDVESNEFTSWFINRIANYNDPSRIIIEFVESENYNDSKKLHNFLNAIRSLGCKIAVDDFGVGYSTYTSIISLKPDFIKIDGTIIKDLVTNNDNNLILESICYMSKLIGSKIVAEFVENKDIQDILKDNNVQYSQGYHFAKPEPFYNLQFNQ